MVETFAETARERIRLPDGGYRRYHLRALAQRIEVAEGSSDHGIARWIAADAGRRIKRGIG